MSNRERPILDFLFSEIPGLTRALRTLGLSKRELEIYVELMVRGELTAKELARRLDMPISKVYDSLAQLLSKRWITRSSGRPYRYSAIPIRSVWGELKKSLMESLNLVENRVVPLLEEWSRTPSGIFRVTLVGRDRLMSYALRILRGQPGDRVRVALSHKELLDVVGSFIHSEERNIGSGISILVDERIYDRAREAGLIGLVEIRKATRMYGSGFIGGEILLIVGESPSLQGFWSDHIYLVELGRGYFDYLWSSSSP